MHITDIKIHQPAGLLRILTDSDVEGWCLCVGEETARHIQSAYRDAVIGRGALDREEIWHEMVGLERFRYQPQTVRGYVDVALWDLAGKRAGLPVYQLLGGYRDRIPAYKSGRDYPEVETYVKDAVQAKEENFRGYKDHCYLGVEGMIKVARAVREAVGDEFHLMHDSVQRYSYTEAVKVGRVLEEQHYYWFEEPLRDFDLLGLKKLSETLDIPIAGAEYLPGSLYSTAQLLALQAVDIVRASVPWRGGITDMIKIARLAEAFGVNCEITSGGLMWGFVHAHVLGAIRNCDFFEAWKVGPQGGEPLITNPLVVENGWLPVPQGAGLGIDLNWTEVEKQTETVI
ncbi:MAG: enolase C-terminal domain-like protein [Planctomycetota bacterium]|jgi:L-alanine-DL-glutamate epimerase-like enolase superfamily enzyme|nr:enolase C-terminal domain-like protein [Planctomycetota bacterium]